MEFNIYVDGEFYARRVMSMQHALTWKRTSVSNGFNVRVVAVGA